MSVDAQHLVCTRKLADCPQNAILLRADIHNLFDDYQWSLWLCQIHFILIFFLMLREPGKPPTIVRFKRSGAAVLDLYDSVDFNSLTLSTTASCNVDLHFRVALLIHVRGVGRHWALMPHCCSTRYCSWLHAAFWPGVKYIYIILSTIRSVS